MDDFFTQEGLRKIASDERLHLAQLEEAIQDVLLAGAVSAKSSSLDQAVLGRAIVPLLLSIVAREYLSICVDMDKRSEPSEMASLASDALAWATRSGQNPSATH